MNEFHANLKKNKTWANETKLEKAAEMVTELDQWWSKKQASQKSLPLHEAPAFTKIEVVNKLAKTNKDWTTAIAAATKKPKEEKKNDTNATSAKEKENEKRTEVAPMPASAKATEEEMKAVREKKAAAVE